MGDKNIKKEVKKKKGGVATLASATIKTPVSQPELIKKKKKTV